MRLESESLRHVLRRRVRDAASLKPVQYALLAKCSVDCAERLSAHLPFATRRLMIKSDGSALRSRVDHPARACRPGKAFGILNALYLVFVLMVLVGLAVRGDSGWFPATSKHQPVAPRGPGP
ncbi:DUF91 domain-containing protein [Cryobacterium gelidum]|uniref:DUF91 domain-containing protein n=1 Tax=Cryobacterium gelidum TaxID=1259164 RepID=A0A4R9AVS4_9MICO|nr:DUF91 domain-containing protein [Cryobacterium gelidum]